MKRTRRRKLFVMLLQNPIEFYKGSLPSRQRSTPAAVQHAADFGAKSSSGARAIKTAAVPEPASAVLLILLAMFGTSEDDE